MIDYEAINQIDKCYEQVKKSSSANTRLMIQLAEKETRIEELEEQITAFKLRNSQEDTLG